MSTRKGKKGGPSQGDQETDTSKLLASATALISEEASEFLPKNQQADFLKKNLDKARPASWAPTPVHSRGLTWRRLRAFFVITEGRCTDEGRCGEAV